VTGRPTPVENMIMPPSAHDVKVISIGMFTKGNTPVVWRGPMLHRALQQFLADVYWGDLDVLLLDLPPGTGDVAISVAQMLPTAELLIVTTPQLAAAEVAERAGAIAQQTHQRITGVIENMSYLVCAHCGEQTEIFGSGGGAEVAAALTRLSGTQVPLLGQVPLDVRLREGGDAGVPLVLGEPDSPAALALRKLSLCLSWLGRVGVVGRTLAGSEHGAVGRAVGHGAGPLGRRVPVSVHLVKQVLLHETLGVQVVDIEVGELGAQPLAQVVLGAFGDPAQVAQGSPGLGGHLGQLVGPEDDKRDHCQDQQLGNRQVEHGQVFLARVRSRSRISTVDRQPNGLTQEASRVNPRDMRFQNPGGASCGSAPTTAVTVWSGASASTV
jgi:hypothetical protein